MNRSTSAKIIKISGYFIMTILVCSCQGNISSGENRNDTSATLSKLFKSSNESNLAINTEFLSKAMREDTHVLLTVDTDNISEETKNESVSLSDNRSDSTENSELPSEHIALVDKNMKIYWSAKALDPESGITIDVLEIFRKPDGGAEILEAVFRDPNKDGIVIGKIKNKKITGLEYYNILIRVNGDTPKTFLIDPKLKMSSVE